MGGAFDRVIEIDLDDIPDAAVPEVLTERQRLILQVKAVAESAFRGRLEDLRNSIKGLQLNGGATYEDIFNLIDAALDNCRKSEARFRERL